MLVLGCLLAWPVAAFAAVDLTEGVYVEDVIPAGALVSGDWTWVMSPAPASGAQSHRGIGSNVNLTQHFFENASSPLWIGTGDTLTTYIYIPSGQVPRMIMLQWKTLTEWEHRAYWGENLCPWGVNGTASRRYMGPISPTRGTWIKLEVPASSVGLEGQNIRGMAFTQYGGTVYWDRSGKRPAPRGNQAAFIGQSVGSTTMPQGSQRTISVTMSNTGSTTWTSAAGYTLGSQNPQDNTFWDSDGRVPLPTSVGPGLWTTFNFTIRAPCTAGSYPLQWRMLREGVAWFGGSTTSVAINVTQVTPPAPFNLSPANNTTLAIPITQPNVTLSWGSVCGATSYAVRADDLTEPSVPRDPRNNCGVSTHYLCVNGVAGTSISLPVKAGHRYRWWVHAVNTAGTSSPTTVEFSVAPRVWIQGIKIDPKGSPFANANAIIDPSGVASTCGRSQAVADQSGSSTACGSSVNPYYASTQVANGMATMTSRIPTSLRNSLVAASVCNESGNYGCTNHLANSYCLAPVVGSYATLNIPIGSQTPSYIDVWWKYLPQGTEGLPRCDEEGAPRITATSAFLSTVRGDLDGDGFVTVTDGVNALRCAAQLPTAYPCLPNGDCDRDGQVTVTDGVNVLRMAVQLNSSCSGTTPPATNYQIGGAYRLKTDDSPPLCTAANPITNSCTCPAGYSAMPIGAARGDGAITPHKGDYKDLVREVIEVVTITNPAGAVWWLGKRIVTAFHLFGIGVDDSPGSPGLVYMCTKPTTTLQGFQGGFSVKTDGSGGTQVNVLTGGYSCPAGTVQDAVAHVLGPGVSNNSLYVCRNPNVSLAGSDQSTYGGMFHQRITGECIRGNVIGDQSLETTLILGLREFDDPKGPGDPRAVSIKDPTGLSCSCRTGYMPLPIANISGWGGSPGVIWLCYSPPLDLPPPAPDPNAGTIRGRVINSLTGEGIEAKVLLSRGRGFRMTNQTTNYSFEFTHLEPALYYLYPIFPPGYERVRWSICYGGDTTCHSHPDVALYEPIRAVPEQYMPVVAGDVIDFRIRFKPID